MFDKFYRFEKSVNFCCVWYSLSFGDNIIVGLLYKLNYRETNFLLFLSKAIYNNTFVLLNHEKNNLDLINTRNNRTNKNRSFKQIGKVKR